MSWRKPELRDLAAKLNQRELNEFRAHPDFATAADPAADILAQTAEYVRGFCRRNKQVTLSPEAGSIPESLMSPAMDVAAFDVLKRISVDINESRRIAWEKAVDLFREVASGAYTPESWSDEGGDGADSNLALPEFGSSNRRFILNEYL